VIHFYNGARELRTIDRYRRSPLKFGPSDVVLYAAEQRWMLLLAWLFMIEHRAFGASCRLIQTD